MAGPIATEAAAAVIEKLQETVVTVKPTEPVPTYPSVSPPNSPPPTPQPTYTVANPSSWLGMNPKLANMVQFGAAGFVVLVCWTLLSNVIDGKQKGQQASDDAQKALLAAFQDDRTQHNLQVRELTQGILKSQNDLQGEIKGLTRAIEKLEARIDGKKEPNPVAGPGNPGG